MPQADQTQAEITIIIIRKVFVKNDEKLRQYDNDSHEENVLNFW